MKLKERRELIGMSQSELSKESGVSLRMIQSYEQGQRDFNGARAITAYKLAKVLGCTIEDLLEL